MKKLLILAIILLGLLLTACENADLSKVSQEDINKVIVCEKPYMRFASGCCMDQNDNKICDSDEGTATVQETTAPPTSEGGGSSGSSFVTAQENCDVSAAIGYKSCKSVFKYNHELLDVTISHPGSAQLTGIKYYAYDLAGNELGGGTKIQVVQGGSEATFELPTTSNLNKIEIRPTLRINGVNSECINQRVIVLPGNCESSQTCSDTDGTNIYTKGECNDGVTTFGISDYCSSSNTLIEYTCYSDNRCRTQQVACQYGCFNGACNINLPITNKLETCTPSGFWMSGGQLFGCNEWKNTGNLLNSIDNSFVTLTNTYNQTIVLRTQFSQNFEILRIIGKAGKGMMTGGGVRSNSCLRIAQGEGDTYANKIFEKCYSDYAPIDETIVIDTTKSLLFNTASQEEGLKLDYVGP